MGGALLAGIICAVAGGLVLLGWCLDLTGTAAVALGSRMMVPPTAFSFLCVGLGLIAASATRARPRVRRWAVVAFAAFTSILPALALSAHAFDLQIDLHPWLWIETTFDDGEPVQRRMSSVSAAALLLIATALGALGWRARWSADFVRLAGGAALTMSWLGAVGLAVDPAHFESIAGYAVMAAPTVTLLAVASAGVLWCSVQTVARLREAHAEVLLAPYLLLGAFALPIALGRTHAVLTQLLDRELATAIITTAFALIATLLLWRATSHMRDLHQQRERLLADLERRVEDRTRELAESNQLLYVSQDRLRETDRRKDEFLATLAHELRNPLAPIRTGIELLKIDRLPERERARTHEVIARQMHHLVRLIDDLLDVSRITANKLTLRQEPVDLVDIIQQAVETAGAAIDAASHALVLDLPDRSAVVLGDATRLTQVVANLLLNACKYTPRGGRIDLAAAIEDSRVRLSVRDNGIGIPEEFLPRLFEKFSQVSPPLDRPEGGLGLGLALVRGLVTLHGGSVEVRSEGTGRGSEFILQLPLAPEGAAAETPPADPPGGPAGPRRVLVVDDNEDSVLALASLLRHQGHLVETALDGDAAVTSAERFRPEIILLDIGMPKLNGYDACRRIRQQPWGQGMRIIAQTGWGQLEDRRRTEEAGFDGHIVKPLDLEALERVLRPL